ncbi:YdiU family protein [Aggregicoccus sp. 17bor-14]|uniref:protein adenylyltransferase SelO n=1 Tax=Myxococcaceae TaxID=31 RepID=UPI00129C3EED|nr:MULTISPECIES: YdiU family protein [Myxococcaceae]MBF5043849.1 YdiU family protein [Simulacricoccus sp. 17bor-14]MRI89601.1 YdiU family protein [Aggregicoccus sp. 17bor-14]
MVRFATRFLDSLPGDPVRDDKRTRQVLGALWSRVSPTPVAQPRLVALSPEVVAMLGLDEASLRSPEGAQVLGGNALWPGMDPYAANYGGHQFGNWAGQLGDGRAIVLGELVGPDGRHHELQLKGAGRTPYSRRADGRAVLRSSIREFLCSEAMHHLGVPTTRALSLVATGEPVIRDMFYDGHPEAEPGAIVCRVAPSFLRFGNFELCASRGDVALLRQLADYTLTHLYPQLGAPSKETYAAFLLEVARRTARLIAHWQAVGFVHGVMNTDNMSILGLTIDYGPYGWVDDFDPGWTPNTTDAEMRRYRYGNQGNIGLWNVERLGVALLPLLDEDEAPVVAALQEYQRVFEAEVMGRYAAKLGLSSLSREGDAELLQSLFTWLAAEETDMTLFFRGLSQVVTTSAEPEAFPPVLQEALYEPVQEAHVAAGLAWLRTWWKRTRAEDAAPAELARRMDAVNPKYVLRNWLAQEAIDAAHVGDDSKVHALLDVMRRPFEEQPGREHYASRRPDWARSKPGCSALSCSS